MTIDCLPCLLWDVCISQCVTRCVAIHFQWKGQLSLSICFSLIFPSSQRVNSPLVTLSKSLKPRLFPSWPWRHFFSSQFFFSSQSPWLTLPWPFQPQFPIVPFFQLASVILVKTRDICQVHSTSRHHGKVPALQRRISNVNKITTKFFLLATYLAWSEQCSLLLGLMVSALLTCGKRESILVRTAIHFSS